MEFISYDQNGNIGAVVSTSDPTFVPDHHLNWLDISDAPFVSTVVNQRENFIVRVNKLGELYVRERTTEEKTGHTLPRSTNERVTPKE